MFDFIWQTLGLFLPIASVLLLGRLAAYFFFRQKSLLFAQRLWRGMTICLWFLLGLIFSAQLIYGSESVRDCLPTFAGGGSSLSVTRNLALLWLGVVTFLVAKDFVHLLVMRRQWRQLSTWQDGNLPALLEELKKVMGVNDSRSLLQSNRKESPFLCPRGIVMPRGLAASLEVDEMKVILAHELAHVHGRDLTWGGVEWLLSRIFFFHPLIWVSLRLQRRLTEAVADHKALKACGIEASDFATVFLKTLSWSQSSSPRGLSATRDFTEMKDRLLILGSKQSSAWAWRPLLAILILTAGGSLASAYEALQSLRTQNDRWAPICMQVSHELILEKWLASTASQNKCE